MKSLILYNNFYDNPQTLFQTIKSLEFKESFYGHEVANFNYIPQSSEQFFQALLNEQVVLGPNSGVFRKPYNPIHFENFAQLSNWIAIAAVESTNLYLWMHIETKATTVFGIDTEINQFVQENCFNPTKWEKISTLHINQGNIVLLRPWMWHSLDPSIVQVFYLGTKEQPLEL